MVDLGFSEQSNMIINTIKKLQKIYAQFINWMDWDAFIGFM